MEINRKASSVNINGKTFENFVYEWHNWLVQQF